VARASDNCDHYSECTDDRGDAAAALGGGGADVPLRVPPSIADSSLTSRRVQATWEPGPLRCDVAVEGFTLSVDEPESVGGTGLGPQPTDLFLASVASCFALALVHSAGKQGLQLRGVQVQAVGEYAGPRFDAVHLAVDVAGPGPVELARLVEAAERVCYVSNTLRTPIALTVEARSDG
jgi:organic hydroperoxide reductase OsmC/OhrA